jgi:methionyl-tRNA formyltransferase
MKNKKEFNVFISGQKHFAESVLAMCLQKGINVVGICCPLDDNYLRRLAVINNIPVIPAGMLNGDTFPNNVDLGITAHSFDYVGKRTRYKARLGWIGFHPSLLPVHRGKSAIQWAIKMRDVITGGTIFWLNSGIDRGDIAYQDFIFIDPALFGVGLKKATSHLWRSELQPLGLALMDKALDEIPQGIIRRHPQDNKFSTFEPSMEVKDIFKPDLLMIEYK